MAKNGKKLAKNDINWHNMVKNWKKMVKKMAKNGKKR